MQKDQQTQQTMWHSVILHTSTNLIPRLYDGWQ